MKILEHDFKMKLLEITKLSKKINMVMVASGSNVMEGSYGKTYIRCMSSVLERIDTIYSWLWNGRWK